MIGLKFRSDRPISPNRHQNARLRMNIANTPGVQAAVAATQSPSQPVDAAQTLVLKKALNLQATDAAALLDALPQPALADSGALGRNLNTFA
jgi:hypothetical protein